MAFDTCELRFWRLAGTTGAALLLVSGLFGAQPAFAEDAGSVFGNAMSWMGLQNKQQEAIDYQPRAPLVVPATRDLPQPHPGASAHGADWPTDPDVIARRRAEADSRRPAPRVATGQPADAAPLKVRMTDCPNGVCSDDSFWDKIKSTFSGGKREVVLNGVEPNRQYLIDPPVGYRRPVDLSQEQPVVAPVQQRRKDTRPSVAPEYAAGVQPAATGNGNPAPEAPPPASEKHFFGLW